MDNIELELNACPLTVNVVAYFDWPSSTMAHAPAVCELFLVPFSNAVQTYKGELYSNRFGAVTVLQIRRDSLCGQIELLCNKTDRYCQHLLHLNHVQAGPSSSDSRLLNGPRA